MDTVEPLFVPRGAACKVEQSLKISSFDMTDESHCIIPATFSNSTPYLLAIKCNVSYSLLPLSIRLTSVNSRFCLPCFLLFLGDTPFSLSGTSVSIFFFQHASYLYASVLERPVSNLCSYANDPYRDCLLRPQLSRKSRPLLKSKSILFL